MTSGGARLRNHLPDPNSARSDRRGYSLLKLSSDAYDGPVPDFPLGDPSVAELEAWAEAWRSPQAKVWALPSEAWRIRTVAMWVRLSIRCESVDAPAALFAQLNRLADQIGMTTVGLAEMGWKLAPPEEPEARQAARRRVKSSRDRVKVAAIDGREVG